MRERGTRAIISIKYATGFNINEYACMYSGLIHRKTLLYNYEARGRFFRLNNLLSSSVAYLEGRI